MAFRFFTQNATKSEAQLLSARNQHVGRGGFPIEGILVGFLDGKTLETMWVKGRDPLIILVNLDSVPVDGSKVNQVEGVPRTDMLQVSTEVGVWGNGKSKDQARADIEQYCAQHIAEYLADQYQGDFPVGDFYDPEQKVLKKDIEDYIEHGMLVKCKMWKPSVSSNLRPGDVVKITGARPQRCVFIPKPRGAGVAKEKAEAAQAEIERLKNAQAAAQAAQDAANDELDEVEVAADGTVNIGGAGDASANGQNGDAANGASAAGAFASSNREPSMFEISFTSNGSCTLSSNNGDGNLLDKLREYFPHDAHTARMPRDRFDGVTLITHLSSFQHREDQLDSMAPGPSVARLIGIPVGEKDYEKPPAGQKEEDTPAREMCMTRYVDQSQYVADFHEEMGDMSCAPFQVQIRLYENHIYDLGITRLEDWRLYGAFPWQGVVVAQCNAQGTLLNGVNQAGEAIKYGKSGFLETYVKTVAWDVPLTMLKYGVEVGGSFLEDLYADVWSEGKDRSGNKKVTLALDELQSHQGLHLNPAHVLGTSSPYININEWNSNAGLFARTRRIFVVPCVPVNAAKVEEFRSAIRSTKDNGDDPSNVEIRQCIYDHQMQVIDNLRAMNMEYRASVLLGRAVTPDVPIFSDAEIEAMEKETDPAKLAPVLRGEASLANNVPSSGFRMLVYAITQDACDAGMERWRQEEPEYADLYDNPVEGDMAAGADAPEAEDDGGVEEMDLGEEEEAPAPAPAPAPAAAPARAPRKPAAKRVKKTTAKAKPRAKGRAIPRPKGRARK